MENNWNLLIDKNDIRKAAISAESNQKPLSEGQILVRIDKLALTSNNITYAILGKPYKYWEFFPSGQEGKGKLPAWGFSEVVKSNHENIFVGERIYGYFPTASELVIQVGGVNKFSLLDASPHRVELPEVYNSYTRTKADLGYRQEFEELQALFQPLFITSFLLEDFLHENNYFEANQIVVTSASSKTAIAFAFALSKRAGKIPNLIGLTSASNVEFVKNLGLYGEVKSYDELESISTRLHTTITDFAGNKDLIGKIQTHFGKSLAYLALIGISHWEKQAFGTDHISEKTQVFFAPTHAKKRMAEWGAKGFQSKVAKIWIPFLQSAKDWVEIKKAKSTEEVSKVYADLVSGEINPREGWIVEVE
jgi:hypothetical protein